MDVPTATLTAVAGIALLASGTAGVLGAGGDILFVPLMLYVLPVVSPSTLDAHTVGALSLVLSLASTGGGGLTHYLGRRVHGAGLGRAAVCLGAFALTGGLLSRVIGGGVLVLLFAILATGVVGLLALPLRAGARVSPARSDGTSLCLLAVTALLCGMIGIGGGFLIVAILLYRVGLPMQLARGTALVLTVCTAAPALIGKITTGQLTTWAPVPVILAAALVGGVLGARAGNGLSEGTLKLTLAAIVLALAVRTWIGVLG